MYHKASVYFVTLIALDRFIGVKFPFSSRKLGRFSSRIVIFLIWLVSVMVSVIPVLLSERFDVSDTSEVCVGIPLVKRPVEKLTEKILQIETQYYKLQQDYVSISDHAYYDLERKKQTA